MDADEIEMCEDFYLYYASAPIIFWVLDDLAEGCGKIFSKFHFNHQFLNELTYGDI